MVITPRACGRPRDPGLGPEFFLAPPQSPVTPGGGGVVTRAPSKENFFWIMAFSSPFFDPYSVSPGDHL